MNKLVKNYIDDADAKYKADLKYLATKISKTFPKADIIISNNFPVWTIDERWIAGMAYRAKGVMFYLMVTAVLDKYEDQLGKLRTGKSCLLYKETKEITKDQLDKLIDKMLVETKKLI